MHSAEKMIREDIKNLDLSSYAPRRRRILTDIKYAFWHGFISEYIYEDLQQFLEQKSNDLFSDINNF